MAPPGATQAGAAGVGFGCAGAFALRGGLGMELQQVPHLLCSVSVWCLTDSAGSRSVICPDTPHPKVERLKLSTAGTQDSPTADGLSGGFEAIRLPGTRAEGHGGNRDLQGRVGEVSKSNPAVVPSRPVPGQMLAGHAGGPALCLRPCWGRRAR